MQAGRTYYWWLRFRHRDDGTTLGPYRVSGPFAFVLVAEPVTPPPPPPTPPPLSKASVSLSSKSSRSAATLVSRSRFDPAGPSIKHVALTALVYDTMKRIQPRTLAIACWNSRDWASVNGKDSGSSTTQGFWNPTLPRWLHLNPHVCERVQGLLDTHRPNPLRAAAIGTVFHEALHAYGIRGEAKATCYAVQLVPYAAETLKLNQRQSAYLSSLAITEKRRNAPRGYWDASCCRDGGAWDFFPDQTNLSSRA